MTTAFHRRYLVSANRKLELVHMSVARSRVMRVKVATRLRYSIMMVLVIEPDLDFPHSLTFLMRNGQQAVRAMCTANILFTG